jgi:hypothetical protein
MSWLYVFIVQIGEFWLALKRNRPIGVCTPGACHTRSASALTDALLSFVGEYNGRHLDILAGKSGLFHPSFFVGVRSFSDSWFEESD